MSVGHVRLIADRGSTRRRLAVVAIIVGAMVFSWLRLRFSYDDFPNPDMAGMAYNAELLLAGGLPYRDSIEFKSPGTFFVHAACFALFGRSLVVVQIIYGLWLALGAWAIARASTRLYGPRSCDGMSTGLAVGLYLWLSASFAPNYSAWMMPAYAWAFFAVVDAVEAGGWRRHGLAGALASLAYLLKTQACVLVLVFAVVWVWAKRRGSPGAVGRAPFWWGAGAVVPFVPLVWLYGRSGALSEFVSGVFPLAVASDYGGAVSSGGWQLLWRVPWQMLATFPLAAMLTVVAAIAVFRTRGRFASLVPPLALLGAAVLAAGLGGQRFYLHYLVQYVPGLALCAAHPAGLEWLGSIRRRVIVRNPGLVVATAAVAVAGAYECVELAYGRGHRYAAMARRLQDGRTAAQAAGTHIRDRTGPDETILAWGWTAWRVYHWAQRRACSRIYKPMGVVTTFNTNTAFAPGQPVALRRGPRADELLAAFREHPPRYVVYSPSYVRTFGATVDPLFAFDELRQLLRAEYRLEATYGDLDLLRRHGP